MYRTAFQRHVYVAQELFQSKRTGIAASDIWNFKLPYNVKMQTNREND